MRLLFFTDTHIRGISPRNRMDNFYETLKLKFNEISQIIKQENVDFVLHGGDWFDRPDISPAIVSEFAKMIQSFERVIYSVAGNHDIFGHNPSTIDRTMLGLLNSIGLINLLKNGQDIILEKDNIKVQLTGSSFKYDIDNGEVNNYYEVKKKNNVDYMINIVHGMLLKKPIYEGINYTLITDIQNTEADFTLAGHYHNGFGIEYVNGRYFINPGSLVRITNAVSEIKRKPKVVIIDLNEKINVYEIELKCAKEGQEILDRSILKDLEDKKSNFINFYKDVLNTSLYEKIDIHKIIDSISQKQDISLKVKEEVIRRIGLADEQFKLGG